MDPSRAYNNNDDEELGGGDSSLPPHIRLLLQGRAAMSQAPLAYPPAAAVYGLSTANPYPMASEPFLSQWSTMVVQPQLPIHQDPVGLNAMNVNAMLAAAAAFEQRRRDAETSSRLVALMGHRSRFDPASIMAASAAFSISSVPHIFASPSRFDDVHPSRPLEAKSAAAATAAQTASSRSRISASCETPEEATRTLKIIGSTLRIKGDPFIDAALITDPGVSVSVRGGRSEYFPDKLYSCLEETEKDDLTDVCGWLAHGRYAIRL
jgi:hypothetical protein